MADTWSELIQDGEHFIREVEQHGYGDILAHFSTSAMEFLENLNTLEEPFKRVLPQITGSDIPLIMFEHDPQTGVLIAKCVHSNPDWKPMLIGLIKTAYLKFNQTEVKVTIRRESEISAGLLTEYEVTAKNTTEIKLNAETIEPAPKINITDNIQRISPATFCKVLPFHFMLDSNMVVVQIGHALARVIRGLRLNQDTFNDRFDMISPVLPTEFDTLRQWTPMPVVITYVKNKTKLREQTDKGTLARCFSNPTKGQHPSQTGDVTLKGEMSYIEESNRLLFLGSPLVQSIDGLSRQGLFLSDIPLHDGTRDLLLLNEQLQAENELAKKLEVTTSRLEEICREQEEEKQLSDNLVYSILPSSVAERLRSGQPIEAEKYRAISILFCGICDFDTYCSTLAPMQVVDLLNDIYTRFDSLTDPKSRGVYKMETVGDKYMLVSGLPEKNSKHSRNIAHAALDMLDTAADISIASQTIKVQIGLHSGEVVTGVIGQKLPHYAVFGGTVCLASRMESTSQANKINCSSMFYKELNDIGCLDDFQFKDRGLLSIKGWNEPLRCYYILRV